MLPDTHIEQRMNNENNKRYPGLQQSQPTIVIHTILHNLGKDEKGTNMNQGKPLKVIICGSLELVLR